MSNNKPSADDRELQEMREHLANQIEAMTPVKYALFSEYIRKHYPELYIELLQMQAEDLEE